MVAPEGAERREVTEVAEKKITPKEPASKSKATSGKSAETRESKKIVKRVAKVSFKGKK